jgi:HK97 family phage portal protein
MRLPAFLTKAARRRPPLSRGFATLPWHVARPEPGYEAQVREAYVANAVGLRAVRMVAESAGSVPLRLARGHPAEPLLARPSQGATGGDLIEAVAAQILLNGNAYVDVIEDAQGWPASLHALRPERVTIEQGPDGWPSAYLYRVGQAVARYPAVDGLGRPGLLHLKSYHPLDDHYGLGCLGAARQAIETHAAASRWNAALMENAARPSGMLVYDAGDGSTLTPEQYDRLKAEMEAGFQGAGNAGRPMLLEGGLKWQALSFSPAELDFAGSKAAAAREIALAFGVPPLLLGLPGDNTHANYREANRALWRLTVLPLTKRIVRGLEAHLKHWWEDVELWLDTDAVPALAAEREELWGMVDRATFLTPEEKRRMLGVDGPSEMEEV